MLDTGWWFEYIGSFAIAVVSLFVTEYYYQTPRTALTYGLISAITVFVVITPLVYFGNRPALNPAATLLSGAQGKLVVSSVISYIAAQLLGFLTAYLFFLAVMKP